MLFLSIVSLYFSPSLLRWLPPFSFPSSETMVKDNIYRKPPIYRQHGTVFLTLASLVWSLHDVFARHLSVIRLYLFSSRPPFCFGFCKSTCAGPVCLVLIYQSIMIPHPRNLFWLRPDFCCSFLQSSLEISFSGDNMVFLKYKLSVYYHNY